MHMIQEILTDAIRSSVLISGLVVVMMMLIESLNIDSRGDFFSGLRRSRLGQVVISAFLGIIPGCMGGFASVSLYTHGILSFGALVAMMIASSGDEAFVLLATVPDKAFMIFLILFVLAVAAGFAVDLIFPRKRSSVSCTMDLHDSTEVAENHGRHLTWHRALMFVGVAAFIAALLAGFLEHEEHVEHPETGIVNLLSEDWMYWLFGALSLLVLAVLIFGNDHFVEEHLWHHIVVKHLPSVFCWTFGVLVALGVLMQVVDISSWISSNTALMILLAALVGIIPESGPHLVFVTLYASGIVPLPVLLASCISQDGHASLPLLAESKKDFLLAKSVNLIVAIAVGFAAMLVC